jgi:hypothetical protein
MDTRIYCVVGGQKMRLVRAGNRSQALRHVAKDSFDVSVATQDQLCDLIVAGTKVEEATAEDV